jgi:HEAT repeat protein
MLKWLAQWLGIGGPTTSRGVREQARHSDPEQRRRAAVTLGTVRDPWACDDLLLLVKDMMGEVREAARASLRMQGTAATAVLIKALEDANPRVAVPAAELLGELKDLDAIRPLLLVMKFGSIEIRAAATRALISYGRSAIPGLILATQDPDPWTRMRGEEILAQIRAAENAAPPQPPAEQPQAPPHPTEQPANPT